MSQSPTYNPRYTQFWGAHPRAAPKSTSMNLLKISSLTETTIAVVIHSYTHSHTYTTTHLHTNTHKHSHTDEYTQGLHT